LKDLWHGGLVDLKCAYCDRELNKHICLDEDEEIEIKNNDLTMCCYCFELCVYEDGEFRKMTDDDLNDLPEDFLLQLQHANKCAKLINQSLKD